MNEVILKAQDLDGYLTETDHEYIDRMTRIYRDVMSSYSILDTSRLEKEKKREEETLIRLFNEMGSMMQEICGAEKGLHVYSFQTPQQNHPEASRLIAKLRDAGVKVREGYDGVHVIGQRTIRPVDVKTLPYPGFPTDMQAQFMALLTLAKGTSVIAETVFENRFRHAEELKKMSADIKIEGSSAVISGIKCLSAAKVEATDLRAGASMIVAALTAEGVSEITNIHHIERGYENICGKLSAVGARIKIEE